MHITKIFLTVHIAILQWNIAIYSVRRPDIWGGKFKCISYLNLAKFKGIYLFLAQFYKVPTTPLYLFLPSCISCPQSVQFVPFSTFPSLSCNSSLFPSLPFPPSPVPPVCSPLYLTLPLLSLQFVPRSTFPSLSCPSSSPFPIMNVPLCVISFLSLQFSFPRSVYPIPILSPPYLSQVLFPSLSFSHLLFKFQQFFFPQS